MDGNLPVIGLFYILVPLDHPFPPRQDKIRSDGGYAMDAYEQTLRKPLTAYMDRNEKSRIICGTI